MTIHICRLCLSLEDMILKEEGTGSTNISTPQRSSPWTLKAGNQPQLCLLLELLYQELLWGILYLSSVRFTISIENSRLTCELFLQEENPREHAMMSRITTTTSFSTRRQTTPGYLQGRWSHRDLAIQLFQLTTSLSSALNGARWSSFTLWWYISRVGSLSTSQIYLCKLSL